MGQEEERIDLTALARAARTRCPVRRSERQSTSHAWHVNVRS
jgi:hypothetical protein